MPSFFSASLDLLPAAYAGGQRVVSDALRDEAVRFEGHSRILLSPLSIHIPSKSLPDTLGWLGGGVLTTRDERSSCLRL